MIIVKFHIVRNAKNKYSQKTKWYLKVNWKGSVNAHALHAESQLNLDSFAKNALTCVWFAIRMFINLPYRTFLIADIRFVIIV